MSEKIKLKKNDISNIYQVLSNLKGNYVNKLKYAIKKNKDFLEESFAQIKTRSEIVNEQFKIYEQKRLDLIREYAVKNEFGQIVRESVDEVRIKKDKFNEFNEKVNELANEYKDAIQLRQKEVNDFNVFLQEEVEVEVYKFSNDLIPDDVPQQDYEKLFPLLKD